MAEKRPMNRLALSNLPTNVPLKKNREDPKKENEPSESLEITLQKPQKASLVHKLIERSFHDDSILYSLEEQIYKEGYEKDYIKFLLHDEKNYVLNTNFLQSTIHSTYSRCYIVNLLQKMQKYFGFPDREYYMAVKLMDYTVQLCEEPREAILLGVTCFWLVHKFSDTDKFISTKNVLKFLSKFITMEYDFTVKDILKMERRILLTSEFKIQFPEPSIYIEHFFRKLKILQNKLAYYGTYFVCDCMSMFPRFSYMQTSHLAVVALYTTLIVLNQDTSRLIKMVENLCRESFIKEIYNGTILKILNIKKCDFQEPFVKFSATERLAVSMLFEKHIQIYQEKMIVVGSPMN